MNCPRCGSNQVHVITNTYNREGGFNGVLACIGVMLFSWVGLLCGLCGMNNERYSRTERICQQCGKRF